MSRKKLLLSLLVLGASLIFASVASAAGPTFTPAIYADGQVWSTKAVTELPAPNGHNNHSFDQLFVITNNPDGQLPVSEAGPGNPHYNGGRWLTKTVEWTQDGFNAHGTVPVLKSYDDIMLHESLGHLTISDGSPEGGPPNYFLCPLLPVK